MVGILLASLIWWDHPNLFNHLSFPYIKRDFSWKRLSKKVKQESKIIEGSIGEDCMENSTLDHS
jgi:hypothetical protein